MHVSQMAPVLRVECLLCGRAAGQLVHGQFVVERGAPHPVVRDGSSRCGECGGTLYLEPEQSRPAALSAVAQLAPGRPATEPAARGRLAALPRQEAAAIRAVPAAAAGPAPFAERVARLSVGDIIETPRGRNSRLVYDDASLDELAASIRQHGVLQPLLVRPAGEADQRHLTLVVNGQRARPSYVVIAGNRRLRAAGRAGLTEVPCLIRVAEADDAFILNVVENVQRRELSGRERVRAIALLAGLADGDGRPLGVREISRRTGLSAATISLWLRIDRQPALQAALEQERVDIGRAMKLVLAPPEELAGLIGKAGALSPAELAREVAALRCDPRAVAERRAAANQRWALVAQRALMRIDDVPGPVRAALEGVRQRLDELLAS